MSERFLIRHPDGRQYKVTQAVFERLYAPYGFYRVGSVEEETVDAPDPDALYSADDLGDEQIEDDSQSDTSLTESLTAAWTGASWHDDEEE